MKEIRIFIASSKELLPERNYLSYLTLAHEEEFEKRNFRVRLSKWEYFDPNMTAGRTEDRYLDEMLQCDGVMVLFRNILGKYTEEEMTKAIAAEQAGATRLKAHEILFAADGNPASGAAKYRSSLPDGAYRTWSSREELRGRFLDFIDRVVQCGNLVEAPGNLRKITAFLAADDELAAERDAFADAVLNVNELLIHRGLRIALRFYDPGHAAGVLDSSEMGLVIYGTNCRVFGREEITQTYERVKDGGLNPRRFYVFFRNLDEATAKALDEAFRTFRDDLVNKLGHFPCQFDDANTLRLICQPLLERYAGEGIETYSTADASSPVFIGREEELDRLYALFEPDREKYFCGRIPVITGAAGTGKSELVRQYASKLRVKFPGGVFQADMERVETVDEAFLRLLDRTSNNGVKVADCLGFGKGRERENDPEKSEFSGTISGADVRDAILRRARTSGPVLLFLDNVEKCGEIFEGGAARFFPAGFSERVKINVVATARVFDADPEDGSIVEFPLGDLSPDAALELLLSEHPAKTDDEKRAAADVAKLLGYRALFLRRVPAIIDTKNFRKAKMVCRSYASLVKALEKDTLTTISRTGKVDELHLPEKLWELTSESLSECLLGDAALRLIRLAAYFPAEGFPKSVLRRLWDAEVFPKFAGEEMTSDEAFEFVLKMCRVYNIFQSADPVRIHRLDREAILRELGGENSEVLDDIGRSLADYVGATPGIWLSLAEQFPRIIRWIPDVVTDGHFYAALLAKRPNQEDKCPWEKLEGSDWARLLAMQPQFADKCPWKELNGSDWVRLLWWQPQFEDKRPWEKLEGCDWATLLRAQPRFANKCPWVKLEGSDWAWLLQEQPQFAGECPWGKLDVSDWAWLLEEQPQFEDKCPWEKLKGWDWASLLEKQPRFADKCPWEKLDGSDWGSLLAEQPRFADKCPWEKLDGSGWASLLAEQPQFADKCPWVKLEGSDWARLLAMQPQFEDKCPWEKLEGSDWAILLWRQPQFEDKCPWVKLDVSDWADLLRKQPQFANKCPWVKLKGWDWAFLLGKLPQFADKCPWEKLDGRNLEYLLRLQPQFAERSLWEKLDGGDWASLLGKLPQFADKCLWEKLKGNHWVWLLRAQPQFADKCPWEKLEGCDWASLLEKQPRFAEKCLWEKLEGRSWARLLREQPQFKDRCPWEKLKGGNWADLLAMQPQFADRCPWEKLEGSDWKSLLGELPQFADKCPWEKLEGSDWAWLLREQPQFADRCPWEKLEGSDWESLLEEQPQFADKCPWEKLEGSDWANLLRDQPQFADKCPWEVLDGEDWASLLGEQPQFAERCPWDTLEGGDWESLLEEQPQFADKCPWEKLEGSNWTWLLIGRPQFADKCPWEKLEGSDWANLLRDQPQFADKCPWEVLDGEDWASLLQKHPQFADKCPWEKLDGRNWANLLRWQPRFADKCDWSKLSEEDWERLLKEQPQFADKRPQKN